MIFHVPAPVVFAVPVPASMGFGSGLAGRGDGRWNERQGRGMTIGIGRGIEFGSGRGEKGRRGGQRSTATRAGL